MVGHSLRSLLKGPNNRAEIIFDVTWVSYEMGDGWCKWVINRDVGGFLNMAVGVDDKPSIIRDRPPTHVSCPFQSHIQKLTVQIIKTTHALLKLITS